jgi:hypothetical protein
MDRQRERRFFFTLEEELKEEQQCTYLRAAAKTLLPTRSFIVPRLALDPALEDRPHGVRLHAWPDLLKTTKPDRFLWKMTSLPGIKMSI